MDRVRDGSGFALIFLLWFYAWATDSTKSFPDCSSCLRSTLPVFSSLLPSQSFCRVPVDAEEHSLSLPGRAEMNEEQKRGNMARFVVSILSPGGIWDV